MILAQKMWPQLKKAYGDGDGGGGILELLTPD